VIPFLVHGRLRLPVVPLLCLFAVAGIREMAHLYREGRRGAFAAAMVAGVLLMGVLNTAWFGIGNVNWSRNYYIEGLAYLDSGDRESAIRSFITSLHENPLQMAAREQLVPLLVESGRLREAAAVAEEAAEMFPELWRSRFLRGSVMLRAGRHEAAVEELSIALERSPKNVKILTNLALAYMHGGEIERSRELCRRALEIDPNADLPAEILRRLDGRGP
jgi:tetratricopeptide (TPR) repeat protein